MTTVADDFRLTSARTQPAAAHPPGSWQARLVDEIEQVIHDARMGQGGICVVSVMVGGGPVRWVVGYARPPRRARQVLRNR